VRSEWIGKSWIESAGEFRCWNWRQMKQSVEWGLAWIAEVLGENLPQCRLVHYKL
jgi:hypothetical protein